MNLKINGYPIILIVLITFLVSVIMTPIVKKIAEHVGAMDVPDGKRKVHTKAIPRMGGLAVFLAFLVGYMLFADKTTQMLSVLIGSFILIITGFMDDIKSLPPKYKFAGQVIAACIVVFYGGISLDHVRIFHQELNFNLISYPLTILFIVSIINAMNFVDGLDGLSSGVSIIYFITIAIIGYIMNKLGGLDVILCLIMIGSCLGFLVYNFNPASIFLGDTGSMFLGFIISVIALLGFKTATITSLIIPILTLFVPIIDMILAMLRRMMSGKSIGDADKEHLHHQILSRTKSVKKSVLIMYAINILFALISIFYTLGDKKLSIVLYIVMLIAFIIIIYKTDILFEHKQKKGK